LLEQLKTGGQLGGLKDYHLRGTIEALAYRAHQAASGAGQRGVLERATVREALIALFQQFDLGDGPANEKAMQVLRYLDEESGLLLYEGGDRYALPHLTYEEYLAACYLVKQERDFEMLAYQHWQADAGRWREVILLALGRMIRSDKRESAAGWLRFLGDSHHGERERPADELQSAVLFAAECLGDIGGRVALYGVTKINLPALWQRMATVLADTVEGQTLPAAERVQAGVYLGRLGDPRPGVCTLPPLMVPIAGGSVVIGVLSDEAEEHEQTYLQANVDSDDARQYTQEETNPTGTPVSIAAFEIARYPVTNAQYALFIESGGYDPAADWWDEPGRTWLTRRRGTAPAKWNSPRLGINRPNHPVEGVTWYEAMAFCRWLSRHPTYNPEGYTYTLPSEAEWEYVARSAERRRYPWGSAEPNAERANFNQIYNGTTAVGCFPTGGTPEGIQDLAGNVLEWTRSVFAPYPYDPADGREDIADPPKKRLTLRGGGWYVLPLFLRAAYRRHFSPDLHFVSLGFRLARHVPATKV
jgi:formylglycine-generating enzyme required for sulfatase activity